MSEKEEVTLELCRPNGTVVTSNRVPRATAEEHLGRQWNSHTFRIAEDQPAVEEVTLEMIRRDGTVVTQSLVPRAAAEECVAEWHGRWTWNGHGYRIAESPVKDD